MNKLKRILKQVNRYEDVTNILKDIISGKKKVSYRSVSGIKDNKTPKSDIYEQLVKTEASNLLEYLNSKDDMEVDIFNLREYVEETVNDLLYNYAKSISLMNSPCVDIDIIRSWQVLQYLIGSIIANDNDIYIPIGWRK